MTDPLSSIELASRATWWHESSIGVTYTAPSTGSEQGQTAWHALGLFADKKMGDTGLEGAPGLTWSVVRRVGGSEVL